MVSLRLDPKSLEETAREVHSYKNPNTCGAGAAASANLDERGLPRDYAFKPDWEITPREVKSMLDRGDKFVLVDCRLPNEHAITHIDGAALIPLQQIGTRIGELEPHANDKIVVHCRSGGRSLQFAQALRQRRIQGRAQHGRRDFAVEQGYQSGRTAVLIVPAHCRYEWV